MVGIQPWLRAGALMRGRLWRWLYAEIAQLDTAATADAQPEGNLHGYDPDYREERVAPPALGESMGQDTRVETLIKLRAQVAMPDFETLVNDINGNGMQSDLTCTFHLKDLEKAGLIDALGYPEIRISYRLNALYARDGVTLIQKFNDPGLYARQVRPQASSIGATRNLVRVVFRSRDQGIKSAQG